MKGWKKFLRAMFFSMAVVSTAHAEGYTIWIKSTTEPASQAQLLSELKKKGVISTSDVIVTRLLADQVYLLAANNGCFTGITEMSQSAFQEAWKVDFLERHNMSIEEDITWKQFLLIGNNRKEKGFAVCSKEITDAFLLRTKSKLQVATLQNAAGALVANSMSSEQFAELQKIQQEIVDIETSLAKVGSDVSQIQERLNKLETRFNEFVTSVDSRLKIVEAGLVENTAELKKMSGEFAAVKAVTEANSQAINGVDAGDLGLAVRVKNAEVDASQAKALATDTSNNFMTTIVVGGFGILAIGGLVIFLLIQIGKALKPDGNKSNNMTGHADLPRAAGKPSQSAGSVFELNTQADKSS